MKHEIKVTTANVKIIIDPQPVLLTILLMNTRPKTAEIIVENDWIIAQSYLKVQSIMNSIVFVPEANNTKNMPVAEATVGRTPKSSKRGLNMTPPPSPSIELRTPHTNPRTQSKSVLQGVH